MLNRMYSGLSLTVAMLAPVAALAAPVEGYEGYGPHMMWGGGWLGWVLGPLMMVLIIGGIVALVVFVVRSLASSAHAAQGPSLFPDPLNILKERFARGEIDKEEYEDRRRVLGE